MTLAQQETDKYVPKFSDGAPYKILKSMIFIFGTAVLTTIAVKNSVNPYIDKVWGASHDFWGALWNAIYNLFGRNDFLVHNVGTTLFAAGSFAVFNAVFLCCDITGYPSWLVQYKVQPGTNQPVDSKSLWSCIRTASFNLLVVSPIVTIITYPITLVGAYHKGDLPSFEQILLEFLVFGTLQEIAFYYSHRMLHFPRFYSRFHKKHHEWTAPIGITAVYCTPLEMVLSNILPVAIGPMVMRSHLFVSWIWTGLVLFSTTLAHGGYHVPFLFSPESHDYHHKVFNCWYGTLGLLDKLHKTDRPFADSIHEARHYISFSLTPVSKLYPDPAVEAKAGKAQ